MTGGVMVFAPAPQLTVTVEQRGGTPELHVHAGGQGVWQARLVAEFGVPVTMCAVLGGETGQLLRRLITDEGITLRAVECDAPNGWYVHDRRGGERRTVAEHRGDPLGRHELDELYGLGLAEGLRAEVTVLSGTPDPSLVPADTYRRMASDLAANGARVAVDLR